MAYSYCVVLIRSTCESCSNYCRRHKMKMKKKMTDLFLRINRKDSRTGKINCCSTYIQVFHRNGYAVHVDFYALCAYVLCKLRFDRVKGQRRDPIFEVHVTLDSKYICTKFRHSTSNRSRLEGKADRQTERQTDGHTYKTIV